MWRVTASSVVFTANCGWFQDRCSIRSLEDHERIWPHTGTRAGGGSDWSRDGKSHLSRLLFKFRLAKQSLEECISSRSWPLYAMTWLLCYLACAEKARQSAQAGGRQSVCATAWCNGSTCAHLSRRVPIDRSSWQGLGWTTRGLLLPSMQRAGVTCAPFCCVQIKSLGRMCALQAHVAAFGTSLSYVHFARLVVQSASVPVHFPHPLE